MKRVEFFLFDKFIKWKKYESNNNFCGYKGEIFYYNERINGKKIINLFLSKLNELPDEYNCCKELLNLFYGFHVLLIETPNIIVCAVDRIRSIPLFYSAFEDQLIITDDANYLRERFNPPFDEKNGTEFLITGYVTGPDTLFINIFQLQAGEYLLYDKLTGKYSIKRYFRYLHGNYFSESEDQLLQSLDEILVRVFTRLIETTVNQGKRIVVPLSGGLDSRLIVAMLKRLGISDVICFSYGKSGNHEAEISKKVADALGYEWHFVEYTSKRWYDCYHSAEMRKYERYAGNLTSLPHIQDFLAVKILKEEGKIPDNAVFVPGHSMDMLVGSWIPPDINRLPHTPDFCIDHIMQKHYSLWEWKKDKNSSLKVLFTEKIQKSLGNININDAVSMANGIEYFNFNERQAKFIVNSVRVYEFFGYEWRLPLWDAELIDFFLRIPLVMRLSQSLYLKYEFKHLFKGELQELSIIPSTTCKKMQSQRKKVNNMIMFILQSSPLIRMILRKLFFFYKIMTEYSSNSMNMYSIMSKKEFIKYIKFCKNINCFFSNRYLHQIGIDLKKIWVRCHFIP